MEKQFLIFLINPECVDLLKEEIKVSYPSLTPSFQKGELLTYLCKGDPQVVLKRPPLFALQAGLFVRKTAELDELATREHRFKVNESEYWVGNFSIWHCDDELELPKEAPSRAYLKMAQLAARSKLKVTSDDYILDIGSAPGGITYFWLSQNIRTLAIDPAVLSEALPRRNLIAEKMTIGHFNNIEKYKDLPISIISCDMNLPQTVSLQETLSVVKKYKATLRYLYINLKTPEKWMLENVKKNLDLVKAAGAVDVWATHLPSHRREYALIAKFK